MSHNIWVPTVGIERGGEERDNMVIRRNSCVGTFVHIDTSEAVCAGSDL